MVLTRVATTAVHKLSCRIVTTKRAAATLAGRCLSSVCPQDRSITIQDVTVPAPPVGSNRPDLVPSLLDNPALLRLRQVLPPSFLSHLRWMLQKDLVLHQDFLLLSQSPRDSRQLLTLYAALVEREIEYISLSRDTSDTDLKQRKEVHNGKTIYQNQAPVRAALHGRLLILDGLEKAERNVLPTLNNLLENREMSLEDGSLLLPKSFMESHEFDGNSQQYQVLPVHPDFRVAALAHPNHSLDPPLRSRFQARFQAPLEPGSILDSLAQTKGGQNLDMAELQEIIQTLNGAPEPLSLDAAMNAVEYLAESHLLGTDSVLRAHGMGVAKASDVAQLEKDTTTLRVDDDSSTFVSTTTSERLSALVASGLERGHATVLVGPKGCGKSALVNELAKQSCQPVALFSLFKDMTSRDLLLSRGTDDEGNTIWRQTPLIHAVETGAWVILDGIDKLSPYTLSSIARLLEQRVIDLPDGRRLHANPNFACLALAHPPKSKTQTWITPEIANMFFWVEMEPPPTVELSTILGKRFPEADPAELQSIVRLRDRLRDALESGAADTLEEREGLELTLRKMRHICKRLGRPGTQLDQLVRDALVTSLMPEREKQIVEQCMQDCNISKSIKGENYWAASGLDEELVAAHRRNPSNPLLVPNPRFQDNAGHTEVLKDLLVAHSVGERALLIMGYQGVGKNRVVDSLLNRLGCEREYVQLHRDTTVQSLLATPLIEDGCIVFQDSPLVRAAKEGRILVMDEADKAPVEVVALLKGLIEDGELALPDGRTLRHKASASQQQDVVSIHPDFSIWALANPPNYPFHGNDLAKEMADIFSCHNVPQLDRQSQFDILSSYGEGLSSNTVNEIIDIWQDLSESHQKGIISYPFSIREAVSVVRHLAQYPEDGILGAVDNVISFDYFDPALLKQLKTILDRHGINVRGIHKEATFVEGGRNGGISSPRTRASHPKHGKVDPDNTPHVGGNTWAGGTGGSDTAGLGGRGGPYRLDVGHKVHQVSDEMKAQVNEEAKQRAKEMGKAALEEKLKELNMGKLDWERYDDLRQRVEAEIQQLKNLLKDVKRRKNERVWLKRQTNGELDDSRIVDALAGERDVFKRRGVPNDNFSSKAHGDDPVTITLLVDVSASMYRFNSFDRRLERLLEATLMIMESLEDDDRFQLQIVGHNGSSAWIPLASADSHKDPRTQLQILEAMVAHTQYTWAGDSTLEAIALATSRAEEDEIIIAVSDANLQRYRIEPGDISSLLHRSDIHSHLVLIGSFGNEALELAESIPNGRAQVCSHSEELPLQLKNIIASISR